SAAEDRRRPAPALPSRAHLWRPAANRPQSIETVSCLGAYVATGCGFDRWLSLIAELAGRGHLGTAPRSNPLRPVLPPGCLLQLRPGLPLLRIGRIGVVSPVLGLRVGRIDDPGDVSRGAQY